MTENKYCIHVGIFGCLGIQLTNEKQKARQGTLACLRVHAPSARPGSTPNSSSRVSLALLVLGRLEEFGMRPGHAHNA